MATRVLHRELSEARAARLEAVDGWVQDPPDIELQAEIRRTVLLVGAFVTTEC